MLRSLSYFSKSQSRQFNNTDREPAVMATMAKHPPSATTPRHQASQLQSARISSLTAAGLLVPETDFPERNASRAGNRPLSARPNSARLEPELLSRLLNYIRTEYKHLHGTPTPDERLQILGSAFDIFITHFGVYGPLLTAIKHAYDESLHYERTRARAVDEISGRLSMMQTETQQLLSELREEAKGQATTLQDEIKERQSQVTAMKRQVVRLELELKNVQVELKRSVRAKEDLEARNLALNQQVDYWQGEANDARRVAEGDDNEMQQLRQKVKTQQHSEELLLAEDIERAQRFEQMKAELQKWKDTAVPAEQLHTANEALKKVTGQLKQSQGDVKEQYRLAAGGETRALFPGEKTPPPKAAPFPAFFCG